MKPVGGIVKRRVPEGHDRVAHIFVDRSRLLENEVGHRRQIFVEKGRKLDRGEAFGQGREGSDVAEHQGEVALLAAKLQVLRMLGEPGDDGGRNEAPERGPDLVNLLPLLAVELAYAG